MKPLLGIVFALVGFGPVFAQSEVHFTSYEVLHTFLSVPPTQGGVISVSRTLLANDQKLDKYFDVDYDINLTASWLLYQASAAGSSWMPSPASLLEVGLLDDRGNPVERKSAFGLTGTYRSSYDFRMLSLYSDPVVSKLQSPGLEFFWDEVRLPESASVPGAIVTHGAVGFAHESNGQFLQRASDFSAIRSIDDSLYDQSFASMGWNYWYLKGAWNIPAPSKHLILATLETRFIIPLLGIEDSTDITNTGIRAGGIWAYDGLRLGVLYQDLGHELGWGGVSARVQVILPSFVDRWGVWQYRSLDIPVGLDATATAEIGTIPCFFGLALGTAQTPSWYFRNTVTLKAGIAFPTSFFLNDLGRS